MKHHLPTDGSNILKRRHIGEAYAGIGSILPHKGMYQILSTHLWWNIDIQGIGF